MILHALLIRCLYHVSDKYGLILKHLDQQIDNHQLSIEEVTPYDINHLVVYIYTDHRI